MSARQFVQYYAADILHQATPVQKRVLLYPFVLDASLGFSSNYIGSALLVLDINQTISQAVLKQSKLRLHPLYRCEEHNQTLYLFEPVVKKRGPSIFDETEELLFCYPEVNYLIPLLELIPTRDYRVSPDEIHQKFLRLVSPNILKRYYQDISRLAIIAKTSPLPTQISLDEHKEECILYESYFGRFIVNGSGESWHETMLELPDRDSIDADMIEPRMFLRMYEGDGENVLRENERILYSVAQMTMAYAEHGIIIDVLDKLCPTAIKKLDTIFVPNQDADVKFISLLPYFLNKHRLKPAEEEAAQYFIRQNFGEYLQIAHMERAAQQVRSLYGVEGSSDATVKPTTPTPDVFFSYARWASKHEGLLAFIFNDLHLSPSKDQSRARFSLSSASIIVALLRSAAVYELIKNSYTSIGGGRHGDQSFDINSTDCCLELAWTAGQISIETINGTTISDIYRSNLFFQEVDGEPLKSILAPKINPQNKPMAGAGGPYCILCNLRTSHSEVEQSLYFAQADTDGFKGTQNPIAIKDRELYKAASAIVRFDDFSSYTLPQTGANAQMPDDFKALAGVVITPLMATDSDVESFSEWLSYYYESVTLISLSAAVSRNGVASTMIVFRSPRAVPSDATQSLNQRRQVQMPVFFKRDNHKAFYETIKNEVSALVYEPIKESYLEKLGMKEYELVTDASTRLDIHDLMDETGADEEDDELSDFNDSTPIAAPDELAQESGDNNKGDLESGDVVDDTVGDTQEADDHVDADATEEADVVDASQDDEAGDNASDSESSAEEEKEQPDEAEDSLDDSSSDASERRESTNDEELGVSANQEEEAQEEQSDSDNEAAVFSAVDDMDGVSEVSDDNIFDDMFGSDSALDNLDLDALLDDTGFDANYDEPALDTEEPSMAPEGLEEDFFTPAEKAE